METNGRTFPANAVGNYGKICKETKQIGLLLTRLLIKAYLYSGRT